MSKVVEAPKVPLNACLLDASCWALMAGEGKSVAVANQSQPTKIAASSDTEAAPRLNNKVMFRELCKESDEVMLKITNVNQ